MRILVLSRYMTQETDEEVFNYRVIENEVVINVCEPLPGFEYDLYHDESFDKERDIWVRLEDTIYGYTDVEDTILRHTNIDFYNKFMLAKKEVELARKAIEDFDESYPDMDLHEFRAYFREERLSLSKKYTEKRIALKLLSGNEEGIMVFGVESVHHIGVNEFCEMNHIDKVIEL